MEIVYFSFIVFLFMLAVFDLVVGVSNDAVNFLNSAIGRTLSHHLDYRVDRGVCGSYDE